MTHAGIRAGLSLRSVTGTSNWLNLATWLESCSQRIRAIVAEVAANHELSDRQVIILWLCVEEPLGLPQNELASRMAVSPPQVCHLLDQLRERGLLESIRDPKDRRRQRSRLTDAGSSAWRELEKELDSRFASFADAREDRPPCREAA